MTGKRVIIQPEKAIHVPEAWGFAQVAGATLTKRGAGGGHAIGKE